MEINMKKHLFTGLSFDLWNTLIKSHPLYKEYRILTIQNFCKELFDKTLTTKFIKNTFSYLERHLDKLQEITGEQVGFYTALTQLLLNLSISSDEINLDVLQLLERCLIQTLKQLPPQWINGVEELLDSIKDTPKVIVSNTNFITGVHLQQVLDFSDFNVLVFSDNIHCAKPSIEIFEIACEQLGQKPYKMLHIGDNPKTDGASVELGMPYFELNHETTTIQDLINHLKH